MEYNFSHDWFSNHIPLFERLLSEFAGRPVHALEVGTHEGRSATWMLTNILTHDQARLVCVDIIEQPVLRANLRASGGHDKTTIEIGKSGDVLEKLPQSAFDLAYVDGSHWACDVLEDAVLAFRRVKVGGIIGFDDYGWDDPAFNQYGTPKPAIDAFLTCYAHKIEVLEHGVQVWVRKIAH